VWLAPLWLTILLIAVVVLGMPVGWVLEDAKRSKELEEAA